MPQPRDLWARLQRGLVHLRHGTLIERLRGELSAYRRRRRRAWWLSHRGKAESFVTILQPGLKMTLYFDDELSRLIYCDDFEWQERQFLNRFLRPGDLFVDVGANIGLFTLIAALRVGCTGQVFAFEPCGKTFSRLQGNIHINHLANVSCFRAALSDVKGEAKLTTSTDGYDAWNSLALPVAGDSLGVQMVPALRWDDFAKEHGLLSRVTMMKIDIEGWETYMLHGAAETLSRPDAPVLQVEFTDKACEAAGSSCEKLYHLLEGFGYQMFVYDWPGERLVADPLRESYPYVNLLAVKQPSQVVVRLNHRGRLSDAISARVR